MFPLRVILGFLTQIIGPGIFFVNVVESRVCLVYPNPCMIHLAYEMWHISTLILLILHFFFRCQVFRSPRGTDDIGLTFMRDLGLCRNSRT